VRQMGRGANQNNAFTSTYERSDSRERIDEDVDASPQSFRNTFIGSTLAARRAGR
jgi:hypothetical protein